MSLYFLFTEVPQKKLQSKITNTEKVLIGGPFVFKDSKGNIFDSEKKLHGKLRLVYFGFTYCPDVCPAALQKISTLVDSLKGLGVDIVPIFITIDPKRDTNEVLEDYMKNFHPDFISLTGDAEEIDRLAKLFKIYYKIAPSKEPNDKDYLIDHSVFIYLMDGDGKYLSHFDSSASEAETLNQLIKILRNNR
ncbi:MAG: SCO family protein [Rickettsiaceae bacterium]|nr:SCO family protein [Rickettsiaceae bacterium]